LAFGAQGGGYRRAGIEQEFFLVDTSGRPSGRADELLEICRERERAAGKNTCVEPECATNMVELQTPPVSSPEELEREYLHALALALGAAREAGLRLYPLATYPLPMTPELRNEPRYAVQLRTMGRERFLHAGRCTGVHLHLEVGPGSVSDRVGVAYDAPKAAWKELLDIYNLATALDPALLSLTRACPFYEGRRAGVATRAAHYRGHPTLAPQGLYANLQAVGALAPYASDVEGLVEAQFARHHAWLGAMAAAGVGPELVAASGGLLQTSWNPVRLNGLGTVELRTMDGNYPEVVLAACSLAHAAADRVRRDGLSVEPSEGVRVFEVEEQSLRIPHWGYLGEDLLLDAMTRGVGSPKIVAYLDSVVEFALPYGGERLRGLHLTRLQTGGYPTTETKISLGYSPGVGRISVEDGLSLVLDACDELEAQVLGHPRMPRKLLFRNDPAASTSSPRGSS
jgi:carboxylate-amine ligase